RIKSARIFPAMPLTSLAPRWARVTPLCPPGTRPGFDARTLVEQANRHSLSGFDPQAKGTPLRVLAECLPEAEGGTDRPLLNQAARIVAYQQSIHPWYVLPRELRELPGEFGNIVRQLFVENSANDQVPGFSEYIRKEQSKVDAARSMLAQEKEAPNDPRLVN